jgi:indole-3-glycerol phosphate synthase
MNVLEKIFNRKREEVTEAKIRTTLSSIKSQAQDADRTRGFKRSLASFNGTALIAEIKKASPSQGVIRADFDAIEIARTYERAGAQCLSVLTDIDYFQGAPEYLTAARRSVVLPCLRKDFIFDPYQVYEARAWGADAILLIAASLSVSDLTELRQLAETLGMDVLIEVHNGEELERAVESGGTLIGVNNRNLVDFSTDLSVSETLIPKFPAHCLAVSESALESFADVERMALAGAKAVLIGTTFTRSPDIGAKVREVMGR